jgi:hypothetical protein
MPDPHRDLAAHKAWLGLLEGQRVGIVVSPPALVAAQAYANTDVIPAQNALLGLLTDKPSDCFETFPFPPDWQQNPALEAAGKAYYNFRAALMIRNNEGLTKTYNRFHDPDERSPDILKLRTLHADMDRAVLDAYGWKDIPTACEFILDHDDGADEDEDAGKKRKKKPYRYRWPDDVRDDVLAKLIELNRVRAEDERRRGVAVTRRAGEAEDEGDGDG